MSNKELEREVNEIIDLLYEAQRDGKGLTEVIHELEAAPNDQNAVRIDLLRTHVSGFDKEDIYEAIKRLEHVSYGLGLEDDQSRIAIDQGIGNLIKKAEAELDSNSASEVAKDFEARLGDVSSESLSDEQRKRIGLLNEYETQTSEPRLERNTAIEAFDKDWQKRWMDLQSEVELARATRSEQLLREGAPIETHPAILAKETAALIERYEAEKDIAARKLDATLPKPKRWLDFLQEQKHEHPDDPTLDSLIEEAKKAPDAGVEGLEKTPPKKVVLADLAHVVEKDGSVTYKRGMFTAIHDRGTRLDVKKTDDRDIEAALKIAAQKFDLQKGLMLTGDAAFKVRTAEIAGRLGLPLQNSEPEVLMAWKKGRDQNKDLARVITPSVERGITGDLAPARPLVDLSGPVLLRADPHTLSNLDKLGLHPDGEGIVAMPAERVMAANAAIRELPTEALAMISRADLAKVDGGLDADAKKVLAAEGMLDPSGNLSAVAKDLIVVRDDRVLRTRESMPEHSREMFGVDYRTSSEYLAERKQEVDPVKVREVSSPEVPERAPRKEKERSHVRQPEHEYEIER